MNKFHFKSSINYSSLAHFSKPNVKGKKKKHRMNVDGCLYPLYFRMMAGFVILQSVTKIIETQHIFMKKFCRSVRLAQTFPKFSLPLVKCYVKSRKGMPGSSGQE